MSEDRAETRVLDDTPDRSQGSPGEGDSPETGGSNEGRAAADEAAEGAPRPARRRRRGGRGGRGRGRSTAGSGDTAHGDDAEDGDRDADAPEGPDGETSGPAGKTKASGSDDDARTAARSGTRGTSSRGTRTTPAPRARSGAKAAAKDAAGEPSEGDGQASAEADAPSGDVDATPGTPRRRSSSSRGGRSRSRGGRGRSAATAEGEAPPGGPGDEPVQVSLDDPPPALAVAAGEATDGEDDDDDARPSGARRRRRRRGGRGRGAGRTAEGDEAATKDDGQEGPAAAKETKREPARRRTARTERKPAAEEQSDATRPTRTRTRRTRTPGGRRRREPQPEVVRVTDKVMLITEVGDRDQIAVMEDRNLVEHYITRAGAKSMVGNIYLARVQNVLPGMEAAFIDVGRGRNAVLYAGEVSYDEEIDGEAPRIEKVLRSGQNVLVQVTKDPMGGKGARLTQQISLPGRFLVLVPNSEVFGISRRLPDKERARLKDILKRIKPEGHGLIVRTAAEGAPADDLQADLERLTAEWEAIAKNAKKGKAPRVIYEEPELTVRVVRDLFTGGEFKEMATDSVPVYDQVVAYLKSVAPDLLPKVRLHQGPLPVFEEYHAVEQIHKALDRKVWLPSGGYLVIDRTEAMTVIDVNTGKHVGKANLEETVTKTNIEASEEVARQLRLRDIGGIIIIDFIDMLLERNKDKVIGTLKNAMAQDKTRSQVFDIGPLGLLEVTRKRVSAGLLESFSETCPTCEGRGILLTYQA